MKCVILCGGRGVIDPETRQRIPKALMQIGGRPLIWHVMKTFAAAGFKYFILALGEGGNLIRQYFSYHHFYARDIALDTDSNQIEYLTQSAEENWHIKLVDTGLNASTGSRIARCHRYIVNQDFFVTYSDCLCNVNLAELVATHKASDKVITVTGVQPSSRFGTFSMSGKKVDGCTIDAKLLKLAAAL